MKSARVVGAGISGLTTAWWLTVAGWDVEVVEAADGPGGLIKTTMMPEGPVERAANAFVWTATAAEWFARLGLTPRFPSPAARRRYIWRGDRPRQWPLNSLETLVASGRLLGAWVRNRHGPFPEETVEAWSNRVLGCAATEWLVGPALQGIYGASPPDLSASLIIANRGRRRGAPRMAAPPGGMGEFIERLYQALRERRVTFRFATPLAGLDPRIPTIICTGARPAACLLADHAPELARAVGNVRTLAAMSVTAFYDHTPRDPHGFGVLFPRGTGFGARGVLFNSDIFGGGGRFRSETWIYTAASADAAWRAPLLLLRADRARLLGHDAAPLGWRAEQIPDALPCYGPAVAGVARCLHQRPAWLGLAGNYVGRLGVSGLLETAEAAARDLRLK